MCVYVYVTVDIAMEHFLLTISTSLSPQTRQEVRNNDNHKKTPLYKLCVFAKQMWKQKLRS